METKELLTRLESISDIQLEVIVKPIFPKIEALAQLLKINLEKRTGLLRVLYQAAILNDLWTESRKDLESFMIEASCIAVLKKITKPTINNIETVLYLARDIIKEIIYKLREIIFDSKSNRDDNL